MRDQLLNGELFYTLKEAQIIIERWRIHYNTVRPHSSLGGQPPAPETIQLGAEAEDYALHGKGGTTTPGFGRAPSALCSSHWP